MSENSTAVEDAVTDGTRRYALYKPKSPSSCSRHSIPLTKLNSWDIVAGTPETCLGRAEPEPDRT
jgi:hypothetical protein